MAQVEPMDLDSLDGDFDNKENTFQHNNVPSRTPCTEKGYEELDVSELNMKLRYSITPASSPMSKSFTGPCLDNRHHNLPDDCLNNSIGNENGNLTRSLHSTFTKGENMKAKVLPLQTLSADPFVDSNMNSCMRRLLDSTNDSNVKISVSVNDVDDNMSLPSTSSSVAHTPDATTPTKEIPKPEGSPILRGLKSMLSMFRPSQSPNPPPDEKIIKEEAVASVVSQCFQISNSDHQSVIESTPLSAIRQKSTNSSRRSSPLKESVVFNDDLERELQWQDKIKNLSKPEKIPIMCVQNPDTKKTVDEINTTVEYMDISCNESISSVKNLPETEPKRTTIECLVNEGAVAVDSDNEFLDCETTFTKNESFVFDKNESEIGCDNQNFTEHAIQSMVTKSFENVNKPNTTVCTKGGEDSDIEKVKHNSSYIKEATQNLLKNECDNILLLSQKENESLNDESQVINNMLQLHNLDATMTLDDKIVNTDDKILGSQMDNVSYNISMDKQKELVLYDEVIGKIESASDISTINMIENHEKVNTLKAHIADNINLTNSDSKLDMQDVNAVTDHSSFDAIMKFQNDNVVNCVLNPKKQTVSPNIEDMKALEESVNLFEIPYSIPASHDSPICVGNTLQSDVTVDLKTQDTIVDGFISHKSENLNIMEFSVKEDINPSSVHFDNSTQFTLDTELIKSKGEEHKKSQANDKKVNNNVESTLENNKKDLVKMIISENAKVQLDELINTSLNIIANDREIPEVSVQNDLLVREAPSEIPLPDEEDIEKNVTDSHDGKMYKEASTTKDVTSEMSDKYSKINIEDTTETTLEHPTSTQNIEGNISKNVDGHNIESVDNSKLNDKLSDTIQSVQKIVVEDVKSNIFECANVETINLVHSEQMDVPSVVLETQTQVEQTKISDVFESHNSLESNKSKKERDIAQIENENIVLEVINTTEELVRDDNNEIVSEILSPISDTEYINKDNVESSEKDIKIYEKVNEIIEKVESEEIPVISRELSDSEIHLVESNKSVCMDKIEENKIDIKAMPGNDLVNTVDDAEEIITSANNSPYVSVTDLNIDDNTNYTLEENDNPVAVNTEIERAISPCIVSKGYNFNFDEIDDPFATKTKIRMSPTPDSPNQSSAVLEREEKMSEETPKKINNKQKILSERKRSVHKKTFNSKVTSKENMCNKTVQKQNVSTPSITHVESKLISTINENIIPKSEDTGALVIESMDVDETLNKTKENNNYEKSETTELSSLNMTIVKEEIHKTVEESQTEKEISKKEEEMKYFVVSNEKSTSSSEQYFSLGTSSGESGNMNRSRNVFNLPEIDDMNFNPFATKSRISISPQPSENILLNEGATNSSFVLHHNEDNNISSKVSCTGKHAFNKVSTKDSSNTSSATFSSNDKDATVREIHTEDEDTIEGPFLECNELNDIDKFTNLDIESGMMDLNELPTQDKDVNIENGELFIDADALEFLLNQNKSTTVLDSGKESLFLKFDPLFAKRVSSDGVLAALHNVQKRQSTPKKISKDIPVAGPSSDKDKHAPVEDVNEDQSAMSKPMMVVNPAVSSIISPRKSISPPRINRRSLTFTSPAIAVIDRLLSLSGNSSHLNHDTSIPLVSREHPETDLAITHLRELLAEKEIHVHNLRSESKDLKDRLAAIEVQVKSLETVSGERLAKINELNERLSEKTKINKSMATVVEEYERTIASLIAESEQDKKRNAEERMRLIKERDEQTAHLSSMEVSFSDLHSKYEKSKQIILNCKANEDIYKKSIEKFEENITKLQNNYELLKQHATFKLNHANQELEKMNRAHDQEVLKLNAMIKRKELHITTLQETLTQKTKANEELTAICDELINKVG